MAEQTILVQKDIKLATGESLSTFSQKLREAGVSYMERKLNVVKGGADTTSIYPIEIFSKSAIFNVYKYGPNVKSSEREAFYAVAYTRKEDGAFEFSTLTEVERVIGFQAKQSATPVSKAKKQAPEHQDAPGWHVKKAFWANVL